MIRISQLKLGVSHTKEDLQSAVLKELKLKKEELLSFSIVKQSIDARKKPDLKYIYTIDVKAVKEESILKRARSKSAVRVTPVSYELPDRGKEPLKKRPVIAGMGPAGLFCGLLLARAGYAPIILERGEDVDARARKVEAFWEQDQFSGISNVQFGEGGAGTFSDGKLNTLVKDEKGRNRYVLETLAQAGADSKILYVNKPHIGTDVLREVVKNIRKEICRLGGDVRFLSQVTDITLEKGKLTSVTIHDKEQMETDVFILAVGHSARDTFEMLNKKPLFMAPKAFAVGLRMEHPQSMINESQYGKKDPSPLMAADYKLAAKLKNGRGVYTFCMCPGGYVVNASSEEKRIAVNGMSYQKRDNTNANSAIVVTVTPEDYTDKGPLGGMEFQRSLEEAAYLCGKGKIPVQLFKDFQSGTVSREFKEVKPEIKGSFCFANLKECLPDFISTSIEQGILEFERKIHGFSRGDAILSGVESRTSSPIRIHRDENFESNLSGFFPCGEGAGYAGGITSAAMDGMKVAESIIKKFSPSY